MTDPDDQLQHFNQITLWLLDLHVPLRRYVRCDPVNPWFTIDIERAMIEKNISYRVWRPGVGIHRYSSNQMQSVWMVCRESSSSLYSRKY
jgi:hypothetical protein